MVISGEKAVKAFSRLGYQIIRQKGSHVRLRHPTDVNRRPLTIPLHNELKPGLLRRIISDANLTREEFRVLPHHFQSHTNFFGITREGT